MRARPVLRACSDATNTARKSQNVDDSLCCSVRGRDKIFGAINFWVLFNREFSVRINRIGARARPS